MPRLLVSLSFIIITMSQDVHKHGYLHHLSCSSDEFPEILRGSIRQDHEGRFYEDFYRSVPVVVHCFLLSLCARAHLKRRLDGRGLSADSGLFCHQGRGSERET